jgi:Acyl-CoA reductase (LuxC)
VIPMPHDFSEIIYLAPRNPDMESVFSAKAFAPFSDDVMMFLQGLSTYLLNSPAAKDYPDVVTFAFWCRSASLMAMKAQHTTESLRLGRGVVFHIAPSNVPVNFAYSMAAGMLAGNANIVRVPSFEYPQVEIISSALRELLQRETHRTIQNHLVLLRYEKNKAITAFFSARCDVRIIWGGDLTIEDIRRSPIPARSFDLTFADRYSLCVIDAAAYCASANPVRTALDFYNDTYLFDQNACTAPHLVIWLGKHDDVESARTLFWDHLHQVVAAKYDLQPVSAVDKFACTCRFAALFGEGRLQKSEDNLIVRIQLDRLLNGLENVHSTCGYFYEFTAHRIEEIVPLVTRKFQTLAYFGFDHATLRRFIEDHRLSGIDRIVPIGRTLDFSLEWDGYNLIGMLSRIVGIAR